MIWRFPAGIFNKYMCMTKTYHGGVDVGVGVCGCVWGGGGVRIVKFT
jgi:hypothetical protein